MKNAEEIKETTLNDASRNIIMHHLGSFQDNDLEAVISDYTNESVLITQDATYKAPEEIKDFFAALMIHFPKQKSSFELDKVVVNNELVYIVWHANTPSLDVSLGTDTFIIRDGKIYQQTFAGQLKFI
jgi:ketosteroid isomerase-like protein